MAPFKLHSRPDGDTMGGTRAQVCPGFPKKIDQAKKQFPLAESPTKSSLGTISPKRKS